MCGEVDELGYIDEELFQRFVELAGQFGVCPEQPSTASALDLSDESARAAYMDDLFKAGLRRSLNDAVSLPEGDRMDSVAGQAIVFARIAGFLAGLLPPEADLFRSVVGSLMEGSREPAKYA